MKKTVKRMLSLLLSAVMLFSSLLCVFAVDYPAGVTRENCEESSYKTDRLITGAVEAISGTSLQTAVRNELFKDETLNSLLTGIYSSIAESAPVLHLVGIDISPEKLSEHLSAYKSVSAALSSSSDWNGVNLENAKWNIENVTEFSDAVGAIFAPFNDVLYMLLCSGRYKTGIICIPGDDGYEKGLMSMLSALGCTYIPKADVFKYEAYYNRNKMMSLITLSLISMLDSVLASPSQRLCEIIPGLADYIKNGGLEKSVNALLRPLTIHIGDYIQLFTGSQMISFIMFIQNPSKYTLRFSENITLVMNEMLESSDFTLPEIDLDALISCKGDKGGAYCLIMRWLIETLKLNSDKITSMLPEDESTQQLLPIAETFLEKDTDELFRLIISLFTLKEGKELEYQWLSHAYTKTQAQYFEGMGEREVGRILEGIDETINDFIVEMSGGEPLTDTIKKTVYSNELLTTLVKGLYGALSGEDMKIVAKLLSIVQAPSQLSLYLSERSLYNARNTLSGYSSWDSIKNINWGFRDGDGKGFKTALTAVLRPFRPVLEAFLANGTAEIFESINIGGTNGYNTAVIPLLEALGCPSKEIKTYDEYIKGRGTDEIITDILNPVFAIVDKLAKKPVYTLTEILPNILFFIDNGSLMQCLDNLLFPITQLMDELSLDMETLGVDIDEIKDIDIISKLTESASSLAEGIDIGKPDLRKLEGMGELIRINSKRTYCSNRVDAEYVKADQNAVLITIITYVIELLGSEENSGMIDSFMGGGQSTGGMFDQYSSGIGEEMADMTTEETILWLYKLFFHERAVVETTQEEYTDTIIYVEEKKNTLNPLPIIIAALVLVAACVVAFLRRERISDYFLYRRERMNEKKQKESGREG